MVVGAALLVVGASAAAPAASNPPLPASMAAIGDSFTVGFATGAPDCAGFQVCSVYSWATGTGVDSHYQRIVALDPNMTGHAHNVAVLGSTMAGFLGQANNASSSAPDYVTVMLGAGDICFGMTPVAQFTAQFRAGMDKFAASSPGSRVLVASVWNLESMRTAVYARNASPTWPLCGSFFTADATTRAAMMQRVGEYNQVLQTECATYANCRFDGNALFDHVWTPDEVSTVDNLHPSVVGQEMISQVLWDAGYWAAPPQPATTGDCKAGGWQGYADAAGRAFKNQGDCVSFVSTGRRNDAGG
jgi:lysophospholipase L1-like esterase